MSPTREPRFVPWWESALAVAESEMRAYLRARLPALAHAHDDVVNDSLLALAERVRSDPSRYPASWQEAQPPASPEDHSYFLKLAQTILRRRIADLFRARAREWARFGARDGDESAGIEAPMDASAERRVLLARMLRICVDAMADLSDEDRELLLAAGTSEGGAPMTDRERQRLRRARAKLLDAVRATMGDSVAGLLRDEE